MDGRTKTEYGQNLKENLQALHQRLVSKQYRRAECGVLANGTIETTPGEQVTVYRIDAAGRRSPATKPIPLTATKPLSLVSPPAVKRQPSK